MRLTDISIVLAPCRFGLWSSAVLRKRSRPPYHARIAVIRARALGFLCNFRTSPTVLSNSTVCSYRSPNFNLRSHRQKPTRMWTAISLLVALMAPADSLRVALPVLREWSDGSADGYRGRRTVASHLPWLRPHCSPRRRRRRMNVQERGKEIKPAGAASVQDINGQNRAEIAVAVLQRSWTCAPWQFLALRTGTAPTAGVRMSVHVSESGTCRSVLEHSKYREYWKEMAWSRFTLVTAFW